MTQIVTTDGRVIFRDGKASAGGSGCCCAKCDVSAAPSGGAGTTVNEYTFPTTEHCILFKWDAYSIPDRFIVEIGGSVVLDTGSVSGSGEQCFLKPAGVTNVKVTVEGPEGTAWVYSIECDKCCKPNCTPPCGEECCSHDESCCNNACCDTVCCNEVCCPPGATCCGGTCCETVCCENVCCPQGQRCRDGVCSPCGCPPNQECCNPNAPEGVPDVCCDYGYCCGESCCESDEICCTKYDENWQIVSQECCPQDRCCNGACCAEGEYCYEGECLKPCSERITWQVPYTPLEGFAFCDRLVIASTTIPVPEGCTWAHIYGNADDAVEIEGQEPVCRGAGLFNYFGIPVSGSLTLYLVDYFRVAASADVVILFHPGEVPAP